MKGGRGIPIHSNFETYVVQPTQNCHELGAEGVVKAKKVRRSTSINCVAKLGPIFSSELGWCHPHPHPTHESLSNI